MPRAVVILMVLLAFLSGCATPLQRPQVPNLDAPECVYRVCDAGQWGKYRPEGFRVEAQPIVVGAAPWELAVGREWIVWTQGHHAMDDSDGYRVLPFLSDHLFAFNRETRQILHRANPGGGPVVDGFVLTGDQVIFGAAQGSGSQFEMERTFRLMEWNLSRDDILPVGIGGDAVSVTGDGDWILLRMADAGRLFQVPVDASEVMAAWNRVSGAVQILEVRPLHVAFEDREVHDMDLQPGAVLVSESRYGSETTHSVVAIDLATGASSVVADGAIPIYFFHPTSAGVVGTGLRDIMRLTDGSWALVQATGPLTSSWIHHDPPVVVWMEKAKSVDRETGRQREALHWVHVESGKHGKVADAGLIGNPVMHDQSIFVADLYQDSRTGRGYGTIYELPCGCN
jgi:hypothetical protein